MNPDDVIKNDASKCFKSNEFDTNHSRGKLNELSNDHRRLRNDDNNDSHSGSSLHLHSPTPPHPPPVPSAHNSNHNQHQPIATQHPPCSTPSSHSTSTDLSPPPLEPNGFTEQSHSVILHIHHNHSSSQTQIQTHLNYNDDDNDDKSLKQAKTWKQKHTERKKLHQCLHCEQSTAWKGTLMRHIRMHIEEMPFICNYCDETFKRNDSLTEHIRIHTGEKPYQCQHCHKSFRTKHGWEHLAKHESCQR